MLTRASSPNGDDVPLADLAHLVPMPRSWQNVGQQDHLKVFEVIWHFEKIDISCRAHMHIMSR